MTTTPTEPNYQNPETILVQNHKITCDGQAGGLGHPRIYLTIGLNGFVECPYCDRKFIFKEPAN